MPHGRLIWVYKPQTPLDNCCLCSIVYSVIHRWSYPHETCTILFNKLLIININISTLLRRATGCLFAWASKQIMAVNHPLFLRQATTSKCCLAGIKKHGKFLQCGVSLSFILVACNTTRRLLLYHRELKKNSRGRRRRQAVKIFWHNPCGLFWARICFNCYTHWLFLLSLKFNCLQRVFLNEEIDDNC